MITAEHEDLLDMATHLVAAYASKNVLPVDQLSETIGAIYAALKGVDRPPAPPVAPTLVPAVPVKRSVMPDHLVCLEDGRHQKTLKRHLRTAHGMTPHEYRARWGLAADYPMVAPNYAAFRSDLAKKNGLGQQSRQSGRRRMGTRRP